MSAAEEEIRAILGEALTAYDSRNYRKAMDLYGDAFLKGAIRLGLRHTLIYDAQLGIASLMIMTDDDCRAAETHLRHLIPGIEAEQAGPTPQALRARTLLGLTLLNQEKESDEAAKILEEVVAHYDKMAEAHLRDALAAMNLHAQAVAAAGDTERAFETDRERLLLVLASPNFTEEELYFELYIFTISSSIAMSKGEAEAHLELQRIVAERLDRENDRRMMVAGVMRRLAEETG